MSEPNGVRWATDADGSAIQALLRQREFALVDRLDFSRIDNTGWLVAEQDGQVVGCCQVFLGRPMGLLEWVAVAPGWEAHGVLEALLAQAGYALRTFGAQMIGGSIAEENVLGHLIAAKRSRWARPGTFYVADLRESVLSRLTGTGN